MNADDRFEQKMMYLFYGNSIIVLINLAFGWWLPCIVSTLCMFFIPLLLIRKDLYKIFEELREANIIANEANLTKLNKEIDEMFSYNKDIPNG